jgi:S-DNA-T family DNA segregation ATPase FtsK/SpoIIIE
MGMIDDPERQEQYPLLLDFSKFNNMMVSGTARSGKTTFVQTALLQLLRKCTPNQLNFYILDYSSRLMSLFRPFQHCGAVLTEAVGESLDSFFNLIDGIIDQRKTLFENLGVDSVEAASAVCEIPIIFVIIDNFSGMKMSKKGEDYAYQIDTHLKRGAQYGVKYLITCSHPNEVNVRARREIDKRIALWAKDKYDYEEILGCKVGYLPPDNPGRGLCVIKGRPLEMQVACVGAALSAGGRLLTLKNKISSCIQASTYKTTAKRLPYVDESISYADFCEMFGHGCMPLGYHLDGAKPISLPFRQFTGLSLYFGNESSTYPVLSNVMCFALREKMQIYVIRGNTRNRMNQLFKERAGAYSEGSMSVFEPSDEGILKLIQALLPELKSRQSLWDKHRTSEVYKKGKVDAFDFMRTHTNPWLLVFEGFEEACCLGVEVTKYLCDLIPKLHEFNMYVIGCFYPSDKYGLKSKDFAKSFNQEDLVLLFGGRYSEQKCTDLPNPYARISSEGDYNRCLMKYRNKLYSLLVPCEEEVSVALHKDDRSIFE